MLNLKIRTAVPDDAIRISRLICDLSCRFIADDFTSRGKSFLLASMTPDAVKGYMRSGYHYHVAEKDGELIGVVAVKNNIHLYHLFVAESFHRQGVAKRLWKVAMENCLSLGNTGEFTVNSSSYARGVYEKLGFVAQSGQKENNGVVYFPMKLELKSCPIKK